MGATKTGHIEDALAAVKLDLADDEMRLLEERYVPTPSLATASRAPSPRPSAGMR